MQLNSIRNCKKKKALLVAKNRGLQLNQAKILRIYPIVLKKKKKSSQTKFYIQLNSIIYIYYWFQKIEDCCLTKQKYFQCKIYNKLLRRKTYPNYILHSLQDQLS